MRRVSSRRDHVDARPGSRARAAPDRPGSRSACPRARACPAMGPMPGTDGAVTDHGPWSGKAHGGRPQGLLGHAAVEEARASRRARASVVDAHPRDSRTRCDRAPAPSTARRCSRRGAKDLDVAVSFATEHRASSAARFDGLAPPLRPRGTPLGRVAQEGIEGRDRHRLRTGAGHGPRRRPGRQQGGVDHRRLPGAASSFAARIDRADRPPRPGRPAGARIPSAVSSLLERLNRPVVAILAVAAIAGVIRSGTCGTPSGLRLRRGLLREGRLHLHRRVRRDLQDRLERRALLGRAQVGRRLVGAPARSASG